MNLPKLPYAYGIMTLAATSKMVPKFSIIVCHSLKSSKTEMLNILEWVPAMYILDKSLTTNPTPRCAIKLPTSEALP